MKQMKEKQNLKQDSNVFKKIPEWLLYVFISAFFLVMYARGSVGITQDSEQYISMNVRREPIYPLFLALFRFFAKEHALEVVGLVQGLLSAVSVSIFLWKISGYFELKLLSKTGVMFIGIIPYIMTGFFSRTHLFVPNMIMCEAVTIPLSLLFFVVMTGILFEGKKRYFVSGAILAFVLSLTRSQMMIMLVIYTIVVFAKLFELRKQKKVLMQMMISVFVFAVLMFGRDLFTKGYNQIVNGQFMATPYAPITYLTHVMYASDEHTGDDITDEITRYFYSEMKRKLTEQKAGYEYAGKGMLNRGLHLESEHDHIKFDMIEKTVYEEYAILQTNDFAIQNQLEDEMADRVLKAVYPKTTARWFYDYISLALIGLIRSVAVVHPVLNVFALFLYLSAVGMMIYSFCRNRRSKAAALMLFALLFICANVAGTAMVIMCLSRYMIYGMPLFYTAYFMLLLEMVGYRKK